MTAPEHSQAGWPLGSQRQAALLHESIHESGSACCDFGPSRGADIVACEGVIGRVRSEIFSVTLYVVDQRKSRLRIIGIPIGQGFGDDRAPPINTNMKLLPATSAAASILGGGPLSFANDGQPCAVADEMDGLID